MNTRRILWFGIGVVVMSMIVLAAVTLVRTTTVVDLIRDDQKIGQQRAKETNENTETIKRLAEVIESCTTPEGECSKRNQARTGAAVATINELTVYAVLCATDLTAAEIPDRVERLRQVNACTRSLYEAKHPEESQ